MRQKRQGEREKYETEHQNCDEDEMMLHWNAMMKMIFDLNQ